MNRIWVNKVSSFEAANRFETKYYAGLSGEVRVETVQLLREMHFKTTGSTLREDGKRLRRVLSVIKQA